MSHITQRQIDDILNQRLGSPQKLLMQSVCSKCGFIKVTEKYCTYCAKKRAVRNQQRREEDRLGVVRKNDIDYAYERLFEERKIAPKELEELKYQTVMSILHELARVLKVSIDETVQIAPHNHKRAARVLRALNRLEKGWAKPRRQRTYPHRTEWAEFVAGDFGLTHY